jgi:hypothetical protein
LESHWGRRWEEEIAELNRVKYSILSAVWEELDKIEEK